MRRESISNLLDEDRVDLLILKSAAGSPSMSTFSAYFLPQFILFYTLVQMDHPDEVEEEEASNRDISTAPIDFGHSDDDNDNDNDSGTNGLNNRAPGRQKSSLSDRLRDWDEDEDEAVRHAMKGSKNETPTASKGPSLSSTSHDSSKKRKDVSEDDESPLREGRNRGSVDDSEATQPQSQIRVPPEKVRKLQKKETRRKGSESDSDDELFSEQSQSFPVSTADTIMQDTSSALLSVPSTGGERLAHPAARAASNSLRSRTTIVDSDED